MSNQGYQQMIYYRIIILGISDTDSSSIRFQTDYLVGRNFLFT